jgi:hypothetical protein
MTEHRENHSWGKEIPERILVHPSYEDIFIQELDRFV